MTGFNQVVIKLQLILTITICDYDEEKQDAITQDALRYPSSRSNRKFALLEIMLEIF